MVEQEKEMNPATKELLATIQEALEKNPDLRVGQLLFNMLETEPAVLSDGRLRYMGHAPSEDIFYVADEAFTHRLKQWLEEQNG